MLSQKLLFMKKFPTRLEIYKKLFGYDSLSSDESGATINAATVFSSQEVNSKYLNKFNEDIDIIPLSLRYKNPASLTTPSQANGINFVTNYGFQNLYKSHLHEECLVKVTDKTQANAIELKNDKCIGITILNDLNNQYDSVYNTFAIQFNKERTYWKGVKNIFIRFENAQSTPTSKSGANYCFKFRVNDNSNNVSAENYPADVYINPASPGFYGILETSKWNREEGIILIDADLFSKFNHYQQLHGSNAFDTFLANPNTLWPDLLRGRIHIWFEFNSVDLDDTRSLENFQFNCSNIFIGNSYQLNIDDSLEMGLTDLSTVTQNKKTGTTYIEKNSKSKNVSFDISILDHDEYHNIFKDIVKEIGNNVMFFPYTYMRQGMTSAQDPSLKLIQNSFTNGGLFYIDDVKIRETQFDFINLGIKLKEYK